VLLGALSGSERRDLMLYASPNSRSLLATAGRVLSADASLLGRIQGTNIHGPSMVAAFAEAVNSLAGLAATDAPQIATRAESARTALGDQFVADQLARSKEMENAASAADDAR
jgi:hypothetical protein